jgi:hypothetical protein
MLLLDSADQVMSCQIPQVLAQNKILVGEIHILKWCEEGQVAGTRKYGDDLDVMPSCQESLESGVIALVVIGAKDRIWGSAE